MILVSCAFNEVHWITRDGENCDFGDNFWDTVTVAINVSYSLTNLEGGYSRERFRYFLYICLGRETYRSCGKYSQVIVHLVYYMDNRRGCCDTGTTRGWIRNSVSHMIFDHMKTVGFKGSLTFDICIEIQVCGRMGLVVFKVPGDYLQRISKNR